MTDAPEPRHDRCETCQWWHVERQAHVVGRHDGGEKRIADCRARAPNLIERDGVMHAGWPRLRHDQWCGAWKKRRVPQGQED